VRCARAGRVSPACACRVLDLTHPEFDWVTEVAQFNREHGRRAGRIAPSAGAGVKMVMMGSNIVLLSGNDSR
jgi:hypothetical protein